MKNILSTQNKHDRDLLIKFYSKGHKYEIKTEPNIKYTSVTTWVHTHFPKFDADAIITKMMNGKNWGPDNKYWGMTPEQIKLSWKNNGDSVANAGTNLHENIEIFMNNTKLNNGYSNKELYDNYISEQNLSINSDNKPEWNYFIEFVKNHSELKPYRTEWLIFDDDVKIAGSIDMVFENPDGTLSIYDWKRSKEINKINNWQQYAINPVISHIHDTNYWHYALQLNTYKFILERKYNKIIKDLYLVRLHPDAKEKTYELIEVPILTKELNELFKERMLQIKRI